MTGLKSERQYAGDTEAIAQDLYRSGQASSLGEARAQAVGQVNQEWATAARREERQRKQEKFEKSLDQMQRDRR